MKVGDYVRTDKGLIGKIIKKEEYSTHCILEYEGQYCKRVLSTSGTDSEVIKSSSSIIDLIEAGDYVNGERVNYIDDCKGAMREFYYIFEEVTHDVGHYEEEIESIVTREQFARMEYKVGDNE